MNIKPGDIVRLKPMKIVQLAKDGDVYVHNGNNYIRFSPDCIEIVESRPLGAGDLVRRSDKGGVWNIVAISEHRAWVCLQGIPCHEIAYMVDLTRADQ